jgi:hypothetical protein
MWIERPSLDAKWIAPSADISPAISESRVGTDRRVVRFRATLDRGGRAMPKMDRDLRGATLNVSRRNKITQASR